MYISEYVCVCVYVHVCVYMCMYEASLYYTVYFRVYIHIIYMYTVHYTDLGGELVSLGGVDQGPLVHTRIQILLCPVERDECLVCSELSRCAKVSQLENKTKKEDIQNTHILLRP